MPVSSVQEANLTAHQVATRSQISEVVSTLIDLLGARLVAYIAGVQEARAAREWASGERQLRALQAEPRLRIALQVVLLLSKTDRRDVVHAWFIGSNPELDDRSPALLLRDGDLAEVGPQVLAAARSFMIGG
jgi:hypothetical protein